MLGGSSWKPWPSHSISEYTEIYGEIWLLDFGPIFDFFPWPRSPGRYLKTFLTPVASFSQSMSPCLPTTTPFSPKITTFPSFHNFVNKPNSSQTQFHLHSISPSTVPPNYRTHLGISATPCYIESSSWLILWIHESRVFWFSVRKHAQKPEIWVSPFSDISRKNNITIWQYKKSPRSILRTLSQYVRTL